MIFSEKVTTRIEDFGKGGYMNPYSLLEIFENAGNRHSEAVNDSAIDGSVNGISWIMTGWYAEIIKTPTYKDVLTVDTWITAKTGTVRSERNFLLKNKNGEIIAKGQTQLSLLDVASGKIIRIPENLCDVYGALKEGAFDKKLPRLSAADSKDGLSEIKIRRTDIDFNGHIHNISYIYLAFEALEGDFLESEKIKTIQIAYKKPLKYGDKAFVGKTCDENSCTVQISSETDVCCIIRMTID